MILVVDIGNTNIVIALYNGSEWVNTQRVKTKYGDACENFRSVIEELDFDKAVVSSVVPKLNAKIKQIIKDNGVNPLWITKDVETGLDKVSIPDELGTDIICNLVAAHSMYPSDYVTVADFGTAFTTSTISPEGEVLGVTISPGLMTSVKALYQNTAQIPQIRLDLPKSVLGRTTIDSVRAGVTYGFIGQLNAIVNEIEKEINHSVKLIVTGGFSRYVKPYLYKVDMADLNLTLEGAIKILGMNNNDKLK